MRSPQLELFSKAAKFYGGSLMTTRRGRMGSRPLATKHTMHLVLRSSLARGEWSFQKHRVEIKRILLKFSARYGVRLIDYANVGNHLHLQIRLMNRHTYRPFIRAVSAAIMMCVTGVSRWHNEHRLAGRRFWDFRPYTRVVVSLRALLRLRDYLAFNRLEGAGFSHFAARWQIARQQDRAGP